ncbi:hypothetical protein GDO81_005765 [Engystomops pustulosus]|uniref:N-acyl-aromatic-L-amino acid amidohydrolase n=1 Tax=Engystomops pustulosus TaxID=76066 RepID=A0AAV7CSQ1_ENGPU|nr:hypothetical protein GDO81_005765 [Engystomops pustulosus]
MGPSKEMLNSACQCSLVSRVVIFGGTHGNEMSGVALAKHWLKEPSELQRKTFVAEPCLANPLAVEKCVRYVDSDLNRCFSEEILSSGSQSMPCYNYLIDIPKKDNVYLQNIGKHSLCLELGPQPQGVTRADVLSRMRELVNCGLDFIDLFNQGKEFPSFETDIYRVLSRVDYPRDSDGEISAIVHSGLQDKDYVPLKPGHPIFTTMNGEDLLYDGETVVYPTFINEAAYYEKKVAFISTEKVHLKVPALKLETGAEHNGTLQ